MSSGPAIVDCVFAMAAHADELAQEIGGGGGAVPVTAAGMGDGARTPGGRRGPELIRKLGAVACPPRLRTAVSHRPESATRRPPSPIEEGGGRIHPAPTPP